MNGVMALMANPTQAKTLITADKKVEGGFQQLLSTLQMGVEQSEGEPKMSPEKVNQLLKKMESMLKEMGIELKDLFSKLEEGMSLENFFSDIEMKLISDQPHHKREGLEDIQKMIQNLDKVEFSQGSEQDPEQKTALIESMEQVLTELKSVVFPAEVERTPIKPIEGISVDVMQSTTSATKNAEANVQQLEKQLHTLWQKFQQLTKSVTTTSTTIEQAQNIDPKTAVAIKQVLQEMSKLIKANPQQAKEMLGQTLKQGGESQQLFKELFQSFQNRQNVPASYHQQTPVKGKDISKWVAQFAEKQQTESTQPKMNGMNGQAQATIPMTKVEQYVVHLNQNQSSQGKQQQFIQEFERVLQSSRLFSNRAGGMEMQLKLRPANMGDMMVRMVQMNGEMAVKILVSSQAAKEMLDGNMSQLRHMFSPQQVIVEKQEQLQSQQAFFQDTEFGEEEQGERGHKPTDDHDTQDDSNEEEELSFHDVLMNEKV
ncbi:flagellar hook-length control protein FliK [Halobacillus locisalis]|uniref:Flagellar hook-length control protein FliK n=1 Tax=Halobacillus locisalis TaxID=220753 RepID=A0A838CQK1_9BACI|nr:flagellar hook-length control protein FliK [Halobacillus locisalis]MBA2174109.1 flagellar hook-length control protein FliK [Halobacillus locisalis]